MDKEYEYQLAHEVVVSTSDIRYWQAVEAMVQELLEVLDSEGAHRMWAVLGRLRAVVGERGSRGDGEQGSKGDG